MKNQPKQKSIFDKDNEKDFIKELDELGKQSLEDFKVVQEQLNKDVENNILDKEDVERITNDFMRSLRESQQQSIKEAEEPALIFDLKDNEIKLYKYSDKILMNIPLIVKQILISKMLLIDVDLNKININTRLSIEENYTGIVTVYYTTKFGSRVTISLDDIHNILLKIDFD